MQRKGSSTSKSTRNTKSGLLDPLPCTNSTLNSHNTSQRQSHSIDYVALLQKNLVKCHHFKSSSGHKFKMFWFITDPLENGRTKLLLYNRFLKRIFYYCIFYYFLSCYSELLQQTTINNQTQRCKGLHV